MKKVMKQVYEAPVVEAVILTTERCFAQSNMLDDMGDNPIIDEDFESLIF